MSAAAPDSGARRLGRAAALGAAVAAAACTLAVLALLAANHVASRRADPLNDPSLSALREQLQAQRQNEALLQRVRALDLLARRAYFGGRAFSRRGALLLLGSTAVLVLSLRAVAALSRDRGPPPPALPAPGSGAKAAALGRWLVGGLGLCLAAVAGISAWVSSSVPPVPVSPPGPVAGPSTPEPVPTPVSAPPQGSAPAPPEASVAVTPSTRPAEAGNWPSFRGPRGDGVAIGATPPVAWDGPSGRNVLWKTPVPKPGFSSPVVWGKRVFLTGGDADAREVYCFDADTGRLLWRRAVEGLPGSPARPPKVTADTGHAAPTAATDGTRVFALFSTGDLVALDFAGNRVWGYNVGVPENPYGHSSSLLTWGGLVFLQFDHLAEAFALAVQADSGRRAWERPRRVTVAWSSPLLAERGGRAELVLAGNPLVAGYDARTGAELWQAECLGGELAPSPAFAAGRVFAANEHARLCAIRPGPPALLEWESREGLPAVSSPLATGERLYLATAEGLVTCFSSAGGSPLWQKQFPEGFYASPILAAGRVYLMDRTGVMRIFEDAPAYRALGSPALGETSTATGAFSGSRLYLRGARHLFALGDRGAP